MDAAIAEALIAGASETILVLDQSGRIVSANPVALDTLGDVTGCVWLNLLDAFSRDKGATLLAQVWAAGRLADWELDHVSSLGYPVLLSCTAFRLAGHADRLALVCRDQTEKLELTGRLAVANQQIEGALLDLEKAHARLKQTQAQLVQSEKMRALGQMVAGVAHEVNNPIAFVANNLVELKRSVGDLLALLDRYAALRATADPAAAADVVAFEQEIELDYLRADLPALLTESSEGAERVRQIVLRLRNFARLDEASLKDVDLNEGVRSTLALVHHRARTQKVQVVEELAALPLVPCQANQINQVFLNLFNNALDAMPSGGTLTVSSQSDARGVAIVVRDSGAGMTPDVLAHLCEPFFTTKPVGAGMGLGLAISHEIVSQHGGELHFASAPGQGTTVTLRLPR